MGNHLKAKAVALQQMRAQEVERLSIRPAEKKKSHEGRVRRNSMPMSPTVNGRNISVGHNVPSKSRMANRDVKQEGHDLLSFEKGDLIVIIQKGQGDKSHLMRGYVWNQTKKAPDQVGWFPRDAVTKT